MKNSEILRIILLAKQFNRRPSEILNIEDDYTAFCFDETCEYIFAHKDSWESSLSNEKGDNLIEFLKNSTNKRGEIID